MINAAVGFFAKASSLDSANQLVKAEPTSVQNSITMKRSDEIVKSPFESLESSSIIVRIAYKVRG